MGKEIRVGASGRKRLQTSRLVEVEESLLKGLEIEVKQARKTIEKLEAILNLVAEQLQWRRKAFTAGDKAMMDDLRGQGLTYKEIGRRIGRSESAVAKYLQAQGKGGNVKR